MRLLIISHYYEPEIGAASSRITNMAEGLSQEGADVSVLTCLPNYPKGRIFKGYRGCFSKREERNGIHVFMYWSYASVSKNPFVRMMGMLSFAITLWCFAFRRSRIKSFDQIIIQSPPILVAFSALVLFKKLYHKKIILNISDLWPLSAVELGAMKEGSTPHRFLLWVEKYLYQHVDAIQGQSNEILSHVKAMGISKPMFLYRNLQHNKEIDISKPNPRTPLKIVYAGLLGVAQNILGIIEDIDFKALGAEFHLYGDGNQSGAIQDYLSTHDTNVFYHGMLSKSEITRILPEYHASIVPLVVRIQGAVPSKIFDLLPMGIPILFCGGGEGAAIVKKYHLGLTSQPGDIEQLRRQIQKIARMSDEQYMQLCNNCLQAANGEFSFDRQIRDYYRFLSNL